MNPRVFIDGQEGTTGLKIYQRLKDRKDIELLLIDPEKRKDPNERKKYMKAADLVFFCLPDAAAAEAAKMLDACGSKARIIDASTAHRTAEGWVYGLPDLSGAQKWAVKKAKRTANPGCHATGFISIVYPLVKSGFLPKDTMLSAFSVTGYSGGGKKMIAAYEGKERAESLSAPRIYGLTQMHKHLPEMQTICGLTHSPVFSPIVADFYSGMAVTLPLSKNQLNGIATAEELQEFYASWYADSQVITAEQTAKNDVNDAGGMLSANALSGTDKLIIAVNGTDGRFTVTAVFDNLGKGASGAAVQNMNLMLGFDETEGLAL